MLTIRLQRAGKRNKPEFRIVLAEKESSASKKFAEILGHYNPRTKDFSIKEERLQYWISQRVELSATVHNLFVTKKLVSAPKVKAFSIPAKPVEPEAKPAEAVAPAEGAAEIAEEPDSPTEVVPETVAEQTPAPADPAKTEAGPQAS